MNIKPAIWILTCNNGEAALKEVLAGLEEEGLLYEIERSSNASAEWLAASAADKSPLETGVGISSVEACMTISKLGGSGCLFKASTGSAEELRRLGANAARYVKGIAFKEK